MMIQGFNYLDFFRSLSFGGLLGAGVAGIIYLKFPYFHSVVGLKSFMLYGGLVGAGAQRGIEAFINALISPIGQFIIYYEKLIELELLLSSEKVSIEQYRTINEKLTEVRFLGAPLPDKSEKAPVLEDLPPKP